MKKYRDFAFPRIIAGVLIGILLFVCTYGYFQYRYAGSLISGFYALRDVEERMLQRYDEGEINETFISMYLNFYRTDYTRLAKADENGNFVTIYETDYSIIPIENGLRHWYYVTDSEDLLASEALGYESQSGFQTKIEYKRCPEASVIADQTDPQRDTTFMLLEISDGFYNDADIFFLATELTGYTGFSSYRVETFYEDDDALHLGKVVEANAYSGEVIKFGKEWDFTVPSEADRYQPVVSDIIDEYNTTLFFFDRPVRPDKFFEQEGDIFFKKSLSDFENTDVPKIAEFNEDGQVYFSHTIADGQEAYGFVELEEINGNTYLLELAATITPFADFYRVFFIIYAIVLALLCTGIPCLAAIKPYRQYKKAYENNVFKNNLIDTLAHNLKTPLQILGGYAENLKDVSDGSEKNHYADRILETTSQMNAGIEAILKTADKTNPVLKKGSVKEVFGSAAEKAGVAIDIKGDSVIKMDRDYLEQAAFCLIDNAGKYKTGDSKVEVTIDKKAIVIKNKTDKDKFTPGTGLAIAGRILEQNNLKLNTAISEGVFEARITKN